APGLRRDVVYVFRERPPMPSEVACSVLPLTERHVCRRLHDQGTTALSMFMISIYALDVDEHIPRDRISRRRPIRPSRSTEHDRFIRSYQLRVSHDSVSLRAQALGEAKRLAQPIDGFPNIVVDENWDNSSGGSRSIRYHALLQRYGVRRTRRL